MTIRTPNRTSCRRNELADAGLWRPVEHHLATALRIGLGVTSTWFPPDGRREERGTPGNVELAARIVIRVELPPFEAAITPRILRRPLAIDPMILAVARRVDGIRGVFGRASTAAPHQKGDAHSAQAQG